MDLSSSVDFLNCMNNCAAKFELSRHHTFIALVQVTKENMPIGSFLIELIQPNLPKFAYNLIRKGRVRI